jgi:hypothetical protein
MRAAYARAFIQDEFKKSKAASDSLYKYVLEKYPNTEYAKQAERNLGMRPTVQTDEDAAHRLFLEAEALRFGGADLAAAVIPAYAKVVAAYPATRESARAQFAIAMLYEDLAFGEGKLPGGLDSAKAAYIALREGYPESPYYPIADAKLEAAGIKRGAAGTPPGTSAPAPGAAAPASQAAPSGGASSDPAAVPSQAPHGRSAPTPSDTSSSSAPDNPREELETDYDNVEQY